MGSSTSLFYCVCGRRQRSFSYTTESIFNAMNKKFVLAQLEFLSAQLKRLNEFNTMLQSTEPLLPHLREEVSSSLEISLVT